MFHHIPKMEKSKKTSLQGVYFQLFSRCIAMKNCLVLYQLLKQNVFQGENFGKFSKIRD